MIQRGQGLGFAREPRQAVGIVRERLGQDLDRDVTVQLGVARTEHLAHAAFADLGRDFVDAETSAGCERQVVGLYRRAGLGTEHVLHDGEGLSDCQGHY